MNAQIHPDTTPLMIDATDRRIVQASQEGLPLTPRPYQQLAQQLGLDAAEVMQRMQRMQQHGIIRRIGAVPNHYALGYRGNGMSVWDVADDKVEEIGRLIGRLDFVSHCYQRPRHLPDWPYNLFAMVHGRDREEVNYKVLIIAALMADDYQGHEVLFSTRILKKTGLRIGAG